MSDFKANQLVVLGTDTGRGNLLGVQAEMAARDYQSEASFTAKLGSYLQAARAQGWLNSRSIVVFPEYTGTWLVAAGESHAVWGAVKRRYSAAKRAAWPKSTRAPFRVWPGSSG